MEIDVSWPNAITHACIQKILSALTVGATDCIHRKQAEFGVASRMFVDPDGMHGLRRLRSSLRACDSVHALDDGPEDKKESMENNAAFCKE